MTLIFLLTILLCIIWLVPIGFIFLFVNSSFRDIDDKITQLKIDIWKRGEVSMKKVYIDNFCEELNYSKIILHIHEEEINFTDLLKKLETDNVNHLYYFDRVKQNGLFYIENCDLQYVTMNSKYCDLYDMVSDYYSVCTLRKDEVGYYIEVPEVF